MTDTHDGAKRLDALRKGKGDPGPVRVDLSGLDDDLIELLTPYKWLGELRTGTMRSWSQDMWRDMLKLAREVQQGRGER